MRNVEFRIPQAMFNELFAHLFPGDHDEHGAVIAAGICESARGPRFLARKLFIAREGIDYVASKYGYRALSADFVARVSHFCAQNRLCYFAIHCHGGSDSVSFSGVDIDSHKRSYPALLDITEGGPVGALVFAENAVAGEVWTRNGVYPLDSMTVIGLNHRRLYPVPQKSAIIADNIYHRQSLLFGARGQEHLKEARIAIIGMGGVGSLVNEWAARIGVGEIVAIDYDKLEPSNNSRVVTARTDTQAEAIRVAREISRNQGSELFVHGRDAEFVNVIVTGTTRIRLAADSHRASRFGIPGAAFSASRLTFSCFAATGTPMGISLLIPGRVDSCFGYSQPIPQLIETGRRHREKLLHFRVIAVPLRRLIINRNYIFFSAATIRVALALEKSSNESKW